MKKSVFAVIALIAVFALVLAGCGKKADPAPSTPETLAASGELGLADCAFTAYAWSSNNGATVSVAAKPNYYAEGMTARFDIRVEGEAVESVDCEWNGTVFKAEADLNAEDGLCYYVVLTSPEERRSRWRSTPPPIPSMKT